MGRGGGSRGGLRRAWLTLHAQQAGGGALLWVGHADHQGRLLSSGAGRDVAGAAGQRRARAGVGRHGGGGGCWRRMTCCTGGERTWVRFVGGWRWRWRSAAVPLLAWACHPARASPPPGRRAGRWPCSGVLTQPDPGACRRAAPPPARCWPPGSAALLAAAGWPPAAGGRAAGQRGQSRPNPCARPAGWWGWWTAGPRPRRHRLRARRRQHHPQGR